MSRLLYDPWTGKPVDRASDLLPSPAGRLCDDCGADVINRCMRCGAPTCCPRCCFEASEALELEDPQ